VQVAVKKQKGVKMSIHGKIVKRVLLTLLMTSMVVWSASVKLRLNSTEVVEGSPLEVQIIAEGKDIQFPDIQDIGGFPVEGNGISSKMESTYINGKFSSKNLKTLHFTFYPEMDMAIPAFSVKIGGKSYQTKAVKIHVVKPSEAVAKSVDGYSLRIRGSKKNLYVGEPFIVTVDFFEPRNSSVVKVEYTPPKFKHFFSQSLGDERLKRSATGTLHTLEYLVSAKKDGNLTILPPKARVGIRSFSGASRDPWGFFGNDVQWRSVRANALVVGVKPVPTNVDMVGIYKIETKVDHKHAKANTPITYTIKISGEGNLDDLANPKFDLPEVTVYGDDPKVESKVIGDKAVSSYERKYVFISDKDFTIPSLTFRSFDYKSQKSKRLSTKSYQIKIEGKAPSSTVPKVVTSSPKMQQATVTAEKTATKKTPDQNQSILEDTQYYQDKATREATGYSLWALIVAYIAGILSLLFGIKLYQWINRRKPHRSTKRYDTKEALKILYPHTNHDKKIEAMVKKLYDIEHGNSTASIDKAELSKMIDEVQE
jgi:hypothetical protein